MLDDRPVPRCAEPDLACPDVRPGRRQWARSAPLSDDELVAWLVGIDTAGPADRCAQELADWLMAAVPRRHWTAVGHLWCTMTGLTTTQAGVIQVAGPLTHDQARHVLWAVRRRARGAVRDELIAQSARRRREIPVGDLQGGFVG